MLPISQPIRRRRAVRARRPLTLEALEDRTLMDAGFLDPTFGSGGRAPAGFAGALHNTAHAAAALPDGKLLVLGTVTRATSGATHFALARYNVDGGLDPTFGAAGRVTTTVVSTEGSSGPIRQFILQAGGKVIVAAGQYGTLTLTRLNADGTLDTSFGTGGQVVVNVPLGRDYQLATQADGRLVVAATAATGAGITPGVFVVARYNADGSPDRTFGVNGEARSGPFGNGSLDRHAVAIQPDGRIVVAAAALQPPTEPLLPRLVLARFTTDGRLDPSFGTGGQSISPFSVRGFSGTLALAVQPDGKLLAASSDHVLSSGGNTDLVRFHADGRPDAGFGTDGQFPSTPGEVRALVAQPDGKILVAGTLGGNFALARHNADGRPDDTFGPGGVQTTDFGSDLDRLEAVVLAAAGRMVAVGSTTGLTRDFALARYNADGTLDAGFGTGGKVVTDFAGPLNDEAQAVVVLPDGRLLVAGTLSAGSSFSGGPPTGPHLAMVRYLPTGAPDPSFGLNGRVTVADLNDVAVALLPDGRFVVAGGARGGLLVVVRFGADGQPDAGFGTGGRATVPFGTPSDFRVMEAAGVVRLDDGRLLVTGFCSGGALLGRFSADGSPDTSFGSGGFAGGCGVGVSFSHRNYTAIQPDGKIVVLTTVMQGLRPIVRTRTLARYNADGSVDTSFRGGNPAIFGDTFALRALPDGRLLTGETTIDRKLVLTRYLADGSLDTAFGGGGRIFSEFDVTSPNEIFAGAGLVVQPDGGIVVTGNFRSFDGPSGPAVVVRFLPTGQTNFSFGVGGVLPTGFGAGPLSALALQPDGKLVAAAWADAADGTRDYLTVRFTMADTFTTVNQRFVGQLYRQLLDRPAEEAGLNGFAGLLESGRATRAQVVQTIIASAEYRQATVRRLYRRLLGREADTGGLEVFTQFLAVGGTVAQAKAAILGSAEYFQKSGGGNDGFLTALYRDVLGREIDPVGQEGYGAALAAGQGRGAVAAQVLGSRESLEWLTRNMYRAYLRRGAELTGLAAFANFLQAGGREETAIVSFLSSGEFAGGL